jgi:hypothetical protein
MLTFKRQSLAVTKPVQTANQIFVTKKLGLSMRVGHRKYIRIDITSLGRGHGGVCLADGNSHKSPFVNFVCQGKFTTSVP